ncbi:MAG: integrase core domain-containing protein [Phycisphaerae bacterium]
MSALAGRPVLAATVIAAGRPPIEAWAVRDEGRLIVWLSNNTPEAQKAVLANPGEGGTVTVWRRKSRGRRAGRPKIKREVRCLIGRMSRENPLWGVPRIQAELKLLGHDVAESTIAQYIDRTSKPPSPTWRTFLKNHAAQIAAIDFFTVPTVTFSVLYCFVILRHSDRKILHVNVAAHPNAEWTANQVVQAFPYDSAPRFLLRDNDSIYGDEFHSRVAHMGIEEVATAYRAPWQNGYVERAIGSIRRECLDHLIVLGENHLLRILAEYVKYYNHARTHQSLDRNSPVPRDVEPPANGRVVATPYLGGLHHRYSRAA